MEDKNKSLQQLIDFRLEKLSKIKIKLKLITLL